MPDLIQTRCQLLKKKKKYIYIVTNWWNPVVAGWGSINLNFSCFLFPVWFVIIQRCIIYCSVYFWSSKSELWNGIMWILLLFFFYDCVKPKLKYFSLNLQSLLFRAWTGKFITWFRDSVTLRQKKIGLCYFFCFAKNLKLVK